MQFVYAVGIRFKNIFIQVVLGLLLSIISFLHFLFDAFSEIFQIFIKYIIKPYLKQWILSTFCTLLRPSSEKNLFHKDFVLCWWWISLNPKRLQVVLNEASLFVIKLSKTAMQLTVLKYFKFYSSEFLIFEFLLLFPPVQQWKSH